MNERSFTSPEARRPTGATAGAGACPVVLVYSLINRPAVFDLAPDRSVVASLIGSGRDVYLVDWGDPGPIEARLDLGGHLSRLARAVRRSLALAGASQAHLLGYCLGGTLALALGALETGLVRSLALLATPVRFRAGASLLATWAAGARVAPEAFAVSAQGNVPGVLLRELLRWQDPIGGLTKWLRLAPRLADRPFVESFVAQERWANGCVDFPGRLFATLIRDLYGDDRLADGTLEAGGRPVRLSALSGTPVLNVVSDGDRIVPPEASLALADLVGQGGRVETARMPGGHIGMTVGRRAPETTHAALVRFFDKVDGGCS